MYVCVCVYVPCDGVQTESKVYSLTLVCGLGMLGQAPADPSNTVGYQAGKIMDGFMDKSKSELVSA